MVELPWSAVAAVTADSAREETRYFTEYRTLLAVGTKRLPSVTRIPPTGWQFILPDVLRDAYSMGLLSLRWRAETREIAFIRTLIMVGIITMSCCGCGSFPLPMAMRRRAILCWQAVVSFPTMPLFPPAAR